MTGYGIMLIPLSWAIGRWDVSQFKSIWSFGPLRFTLHRKLDRWKK